MKPLGRNILVTLTQKTTSAGGIILPDSKQAVQQGTTKVVVLEVGPKCEEEIRPGDEVIPRPTAAMFLLAKTDDGVQTAIVHETELLAVK